MRRVRRVHKPTPSDTPAPAAPRPLRELWPPHAGPAPDILVSGIASSSRDVVPGSIFVALRGTQRDGHDFLPDAVARGAAAVVVEPGFAASLAVPTFEVGNPRALLAELAANWHLRPAERLTLVGITGTVGKTSVLTMLEAALQAAAADAGVIGSLGLRIRGAPQQETPYTSPDALLLHYWLARLVDAGCTLAAMEVTSHALVQGRVHGLRFDLGIFTNLIPLEHTEFHGTFRSYVQAKQRFFEHVRPGAPLLYNADDRAVRRLVRDSSAVPIGCGASRTAHVRVRDIDMDASGTRFTLQLRRPLPRVCGGEVAPFELPLRLRLLGRSSVANATLAASAALSLGVGPRDVAAAFARLEPARRRMQLLHGADFLILDDTTGHPESITAVFEVAGALRPRRLHVAYVVRGHRGARINEQLGATLAIWCAQLPTATLVVSRASDTADERNRVTDEEHAAFVAPLASAGVAYRDVDRLEDAVPAVLERAAPGDLVLLLGAQGMNEGQRIARAWLDTR